MIQHTAPCSLLGQPLCHNCSGAARSTRAARLTRALSNAILILYSKLGLYRPKAKLQPAGRSFRVRIGCQSNIFCFSAVANAYGNFFSKATVLKRSCRVCGRHNALRRKWGARRGAKPKKVPKNGGPWPYCQALQVAFCCRGSFVCGFNSFICVVKRLSRQK